MKKDKATKAKNTCPHLDYHHPHAILGLHVDIDGQKVIRLWRPNAQHIHLEVFGNIVTAVKVDEAGLFEYLVPEHTQALDYRIYHHNGMLAFDPYAFMPTFAEIDQYLFNKGVHYQLYQTLGGRLTVHQGVYGVQFSVFAPSAKSVFLQGDFNHWDSKINPMRSLGHCGVFEIFIPGIGEGEKYKFEITTQEGHLLTKADPMAYMSELRPKTASIIANLDRFAWSDKDWVAKRAKTNALQRPINIYEVHLGSWKKEAGNFLNYKEIAIELAKYALEMGFTHVELMPIQEHPLDESWGYQVSGFYAVTSRFGCPEDFQWFVNHLHMKGIGVILDWVPGHFPTDSFSLGRFDGTSLYEHMDSRQGFHPHWGTYIFNFGRNEVANFLIANALFWFEQMHIDGLRVDAVASMLYLDYGRNEGDWIPNRYGGKENLEAIEFIKHLNSIVHERYPGALMIAEESTSFKGVTASLENGALGFDLKWNLGWMNDTLHYIKRDPLFRKFHQNELTFGLLYAFSEKFALVLSHDEVVHGKKSLLSKMPGDMWQKFANLRLLLSYMICQPGKKLLFMGAEIGQWNEWNCKSEIEWELLKYPLHSGLKEMVKDLNHFYLANEPIWSNDFEPSGFEWIDFSDTENCTLSYFRKSANKKLICIHNFSPSYVNNYRLTLKLEGIAKIAEVFNSDTKKYGGSGQTNDVISFHKNTSGDAMAIFFNLSPLATMIFTVE